VARNERAAEGQPPPGVAIGTCAEVWETGPLSGATGSSHEGPAFSRMGGVSSTAGRVAIAEGLECSNRATKKFPGQRCRDGKSCSAEPQLQPVCQSPKFSTRDGYLRDARSRRQVAAAVGGRRRRKHGDGFALDERWQELFTGDLCREAVGASVGVLLVTVDDDWVRVSQVLRACNDSGMGRPSGATGHLVNSE